MEALKLIEKAKEEEAKHLEASVQNAIFIFSSIWDSQLK